VVSIWVLGGTPGQYEVFGIADTSSGKQIPVKFNFLIMVGIFMVGNSGGVEVTSNGTPLQMSNTNFKYDVTATAANTINLPTNPIPYKEYTITDAGNNFGTYNQTIEPIGFIMGLNDENGSSKKFYYAPTASAWRIEL